MKPRCLRRFFSRCVLGGLLAALALGAAAQGDAALRGTSLDGQAFDLARQKGRVVMVVLWRTDCAVCLNKMPELRANALGWKASAFDLVTVSLDTRREDALAYDSTRRLVAASAGPVVSLWHGDTDVSAAWHKGLRLPITLVIDSKGQIVGRHEGRVPAELWNQIADLVP